MEFDLHSKYDPAGDQPKAIDELMYNIDNQNHHQVLLGATGTGKTFTIANVINKHKKPTLVLAHNKTLASQLYGELKEFFPNNRVEYFVSYFDYYQPEAYLPGNDLYIEKDSKINDEIERLRHSATASLFEGDDVIVVSSVSCIYGLGSPIDYKNMAFSVRVGQIINQKEFIYKLIEMQYSRNDMEAKRSTFRVRGDIIEFVSPQNETLSYKIEFWDDEIESIKEVNSLTGKTIVKLKHVVIFPASHYVVDSEKMKPIIEEIRKDKDKEVAAFIAQDKLLEAQRLKQRTEYDLEMMAEVGYCSGIENYTRYLAGLKEDQTPYTLFDYFPEDFLMVIDESHVTIPQVRAMYNGDRARKQNLVDYGFRLQAALDNRPLRFEEFEKKIHDIIYVSATPSDYEVEMSNGHIVEQIIRPTGLLDPEIDIVPKENQIDHIISTIKSPDINKVLITTLTKKMAEDLTDYLKEQGIKVAYLHSDIKTLERVQIIKQLRGGKYDVLIGINLLREGLDIPEVDRVLILDADKQGFLRSTTSLVQTIGRAARNSNGRVVMYADKESQAMKEAIDETMRRRSIQIAFNEKHGTSPMTIQKEIGEFELLSDNELDKLTSKKVNKEDKQNILNDLRKEMQKASKELNFEEAARLRDLIIEIESGK